MMNFVFIILVVLSVSMCIYCVPKRYDNYKVFRIVPTTAEHVEMLSQFAKKKGNSFWVRPHGLTKAVDLQVAPNHLNEFYDLMTTAGLRYMLSIANMQTLIDKEKAPISQSRAGGSFNFNRYNTLDDIYAWMNSLTSTHPDNVEKIIGGTTFQGRQIEGVRLMFGLERPGIFIEGGMHPREWISPATVVYLIDRLLNSNEPMIRQLAESYNWYMFPVCNPDGYVYSHDFDRMWQKTLSDTGAGVDPSEPECKGVDLNRNFNYKWQEQNERETNPCHDRYPGHAALSEIESQTLSAYISGLRGKLFAYLSFHSYWQALLLPYSHTDERFENYDEAFAIGSNAIIALSRKFNTQYQIGTKREIFGFDTGSATDWVKGVIDIELVYTYKLRDRKGFLLPEKYIDPNNQEVLDSLLAMFQRAHSLGYPKNKMTGKIGYSGESSSSGLTDCVGSVECVGSIKRKFKLPRCFRG